MHREIIEKIVRENENVLFMYNICNRYLGHYFIYPSQI